MPGDPIVQFLRLDGAWPSVVETRAVERDGDVLRLARLPAAPEPVTTAAPGEAVAGAAGIGVARDGTLYVADPAAHRIVRVDPCGGAGEPLPCLGGPGREVGQLDTPRGVIVGPRGALYVADSGNHRVQVIDPRTMQVRAVWGATDDDGTPVASDDDGGLRAPWDLAADEACNVYVCSPAIPARGAEPAHAGRVQKFDADGRVDPTFWATMRDGSPPASPTAIAVVAWPSEAGGAADGERLVVVDEEGARLLVYRLNGEYDGGVTARFSDLAFRARRPSAVVADGDFLYVADAGRARVLVFARDGTFVGLARGFAGAAAGLAIDSRGRLLVHSGAGAGVQRFAESESYAECGTFLAGPFEGGAGASLFRAVATVDGLGESAHLRLYTLTSDTLDGAGGSVPAPPADCAAWSVSLAADPAPAGSGAPTPRDAWRAAPVDATELLLLHEPARYLWLGGVMRGGGSSSPVLRQLRLEYNHTGWLRHLPSLYSREENGRAFLERALALFESVLAEEDRLVDRLPELFDPWAAPDGGRAAADGTTGPGQWLEWLADWVAVPLDERWSGEKRRAAVAGAFASHGRRGTVQSLEQLVELYTGARVRIDEPAAHAAIWSLGGAGLGLSTMLAAAQPEGAILGATATLDQAHLIDEREEGAPLFEDLAHHFRVELFATDLATPDAVDEVRRVIEREKPAHTTFDLCLIEPRMRVGVQARVGVDALVGAPPPPFVVGGGAALGVDAVLAEERHRGPIVGRTARVGLSGTIE